MKTKKEKKHKHNFIWNNRKHPKCKCGYNQSPKPEKKCNCYCHQGYFTEYCNVCYKNHNPKPEKKVRIEGLRFLQTQYEYPVGLSYTSVLIEYAYFLDENKLEVIKFII